MGKTEVNKNHILKNKVPEIVDKSAAVRSSNDFAAARHVEGSDWKWTLWLPYSDPADSFFDLELVNQDNAHRCVCHVLSVTEHEEGGALMCFDLSPLKATVEDCLLQKWIVKISSAEMLPLAEPDRRRADAEENQSIKNSNDPFERRLDRFANPIGQMEFAGRTVEAVPYCMGNGSWKLSVGDQCHRYMNALKCVGLEFRIRAGVPYFRVACPAVNGVEWIGMVLTYRYHLEPDRRDYFFPVCKIKREGQILRADTEIRHTGLELKPVFWDVRMAFEKDGEQYWCHVIFPDADENLITRNSRCRTIKEILSEKSTDLSDGFQLSIARTDKGNTTITIQQRTPYSGLKFRLKERLAIMLFRIMRKRLGREKIFLVYEKFCNMAQDNGFYFFKYCMDNDMEKVMDRRIYYVIDKKQPDYCRIEPYKDHVIQFMSLKHMVYILASRLLISSDSRKHSYAWRATESTIRKVILKSGKSVFLQHGVFGLKRTNEFAHGTGGGTDLFIASNEMEKGFIVDDMGYKPDQIAVTGLARWDVLEDKSEGEEKKRILVMPTWRNWLEETTDEIFLESEYYLKYMKLINSQELSDYLERHDLLMDFYIHPKFNEKIEQFAAVSDRINLIPLGGEPLNELLMKCSLLVTDYSSVCWDVYYQGKPVIFYQFDLAKYNETQGAYMDLEKDLFGDRAETQEELLKLLEEAAEGGFALKPQYAGMRENMYAFIDHNNSKRICEEIMKREW